MNKFKTLKFLIGLNLTYFKAILTGRVPTLCTTTDIWNLSPLAVRELSFGFAKTKFWTCIRGREQLVEVPTYQITGITINHYTDL